MKNIFSSKMAGVISRWQALIPQKRILLITLLFCPRLSPAQNNSSGFASADANLNSTYKQASERLAPPNQEVLRRAERAWINFYNKEKALVDTLQRENLVPEQFAHAANILEVNTRSNHLTSFFLADKVPFAEPYMLQNLDQAMSKTYKDCMGRLSATNQGLLKDAERAWVTYRDADAASVMTAYGNQTVKTAAAAHSTGMRNAQLTAIVQSVRETPTTNTATQEFPPLPSPPPPLQSSSLKFSPNPDDVKAIADFQDQAKAVLNALLAKTDAPFFKKTDAIKTVPELPAESVDQILKLHAQYGELSRRPYSAKLLEPALNECAAVELLVSWSKFANQLKTGSVDDAGSTLQNGVSQKPKDITADYLPLWKTAESWQGVYVNFHEHFQKAKSFAAASKTSEAIKEYQAAYDIIETPSITEQIKKLREQSLGL